MRSIALVLLVFFPFFLTAQLREQRKLDSFLAVNAGHPAEDSAKVMNLVKIFRQYSLMKQVDKFNLYADSAVLIASRLPSKKLLYHVYNRIAFNYFYKDRLMAIEYFGKAGEAARAVNNKKAEADNNLSLGALYMEMRDYPRSLDVNEKAIELYIQAGFPDETASCYMNLGNIYLDMGYRGKGIEYTKKALAVFERAVGSEYGVAIAYNTLADQYLQVSDKELSQLGINPRDRYKATSQAIDRALHAAGIAEGHAMISSLYVTKGKMYEQQNDLPQAKKYYQMALDTSSHHADEEEHPNNLMTMGNFQVQRLNNIQEGLRLLHQALPMARLSGRMQTEESILRSFSDAFEKQKSYDSALYYYRLAIVVKDSLFNQAKEQEITRRQLKIDFDAKERDYKNAQQLADVKLKAQQQEILLRSQQLQISDKEKTLQRLTFLQKQAELESQKRTQQQLLAKEELRNNYETKFKDQRIEVQRLELVSNRRLSIFLAVMAILVFAGALFTYESHKKTIKLNRQVSQQKVALEELVKVKDRIFSVVSHDMRGPVNNLMAFSTILEQADISKEQLAVYLQQIRGTLDHTSSLVENLLNWSASQMSGFTPVIEPVDINAALKQALRGVETAIHNKQLSIYNAVTPGVMVSGDRHMTELIIRNLVTNAVKFSQKGGKLELMAHATNNEVVLSIKDHGVGMDTKKVDLINSASVGALESTTGTAREKGTGLGLMLSKHFAKLMGGNISVDSNPGAGSSFYVSLPAAA
jgi:signal transduction histidine kinase